MGSPGHRVALLPPSVPGAFTLAGSGRTAPSPAGAATILGSPRCRAARSPLLVLEAFTLAGCGWTALSPVGSMIIMSKARRRLEPSPPSVPERFTPAGCGRTTPLACWGRDAYGVGKAMPPGGTFTAVSTGGDHTCGLRTDDTLACWGLDNTGQATPPSGTFTVVSARGLAHLRSADGWHPRLLGL